MPKQAKKLPVKFVSRMDEAYKEKIVDYNPPTLVGYWLNKIEGVEGKMIMVKKKRSRCETITMRKNILFANLLKPSLLEQAKPYISYGDALQIATDDIQCTEYGIKHYVITAIITERDMDYLLNLCHGCPIVATLNTQPCVRNTLTIEDPKEGRKSKTLTYGKDVYISMYHHEEKRPLYIQAEVTSVDTFGDENDHFPLKLSEHPDRYCKFKIVHEDPTKRDVSIGDVVPSNTKVCIVHVVTNRFLVTERTYFASLFGTEMAVSCYIYQRRGKQDPCNFWQLSIQRKKDTKIKGK